MFGIDDAILFSAGASLLGGVLRNQGSARSAERQMDFQAMMSNTAHQREVADLRAAGLNPILSAGGKGASTPPGAMAPVEDVLSPAVSSAREAARVTSENALRQANIGVLQEEKRLKAAEAGIKEWELKNKSAVFQPLHDAKSGIQDFLSDPDLYYGLGQSAKELARKLGVSVERAKDAILRAVDPQHPVNVERRAAGARATAGRGYGGWDVSPEYVQEFLEKSGAYPPVTAPLLKFKRGSRNARVRSVFD